MPSMRLLVILGAVAAAMVGGWQTYRQLSRPRATATVVRRWDQPRYDERSKRMAEEHCVELAYAFEGRDQRANDCSWNQYPDRELVVRVDPSHPGRVAPHDASDWFTIALLWAIGPFIGWLALVMYGYAPLHDRLAKPDRRRKHRR